LLLFGRFGPLGFIDLPLHEVSQLFHTILQI